MVSFVVSFFRDFVINIFFFSDLSYTDTSIEFIASDL